MPFTILDNCIFLFNLYGVHPAKTGNKLQTFFFIFYLVQFSLLSGLILMLLVYADYVMNPVEMIDVLTSFLIQVHALLYLICLYIQRSKIWNLLRLMDQYFWAPENYTSSAELQEAYQGSMKKIKTKYIGYITIMLVCATNYCYGRIAQDHRYIAANMVFKSYIPPGVHFWVLFCWEHIHAAGVINLMISMNFCLCSIISSTTFQFRLLRYEIENLFSHYNGENEQSNDEHFAMKLKRCNDQHNFLLSFRKLVVDTFSTLMFIYFGIVVIILVLETYLLLSINTFVDILRTVTYTALMYFEFFTVFCIPAQELTNEAELLSTELYCNSNWYKYPSHYKDILILLSKSQIKIIFTAGGLFDLDLGTGMAAIKSMFSFSMFLRSVTNME